MTTLAIAAAKLAQGDAAGAYAALTALLGSTAFPARECATILAQRARSLTAMRNVAAAAADLQRAVHLVADDAGLWASLGIARADMRDLPAAVQAFTRSTEIDPANARVWNNLGIAQWQAGVIEPAVESFGRSVAIDPRYALAWANFGSVLRITGRRAPAEDALKRALAIDPDLLAALVPLAALKRDNAQADEAIALYARAAKLAPGDAETCTSLARLLADRDDLPEARRVYAEAARRDPRMLRAWLGQYLLLPQIYEDSAEVDAARDEYTRGLATLERGLGEIAEDMPYLERVDSLRWNNFLLAYQGRDDRELQQRYGQLVASVLAPGMPAPPVARKRGAGERIRVGFASFFMRKSTVGYYFLSWVRDLPRDVFDVYVYHLYGSDDPVVGQIRESAQVFRNLPRMMPSRVAQAIRDDALDVLIYPELGMDATSFALAAMKLAPVQCAAWGHPVTTGHPAIDVFFSSDAMEPADAQRMYTERLVRLPGIGTRYAMPVAPADGTREKFGLPVGRPLYFCPQSLFKILPDDDALLAQVLAAVPEAALVLCDARSANITRRFRARLDAAIERAGIAPEGRVFFLPTLDHEDYLRANTVCDAMLDTTHWSGGNTSIDAIAAGLPIVTMQGEFMRSRQSAAMLAIIGADELVAHSRDEYVATAVRIVRDAQWRKTMIGKIVDGRHRLFDDPRPVAALAEALRRLCDVPH